MTMKYWLILLFAGMHTVGVAQKIATLEVNLAQPANGLSIPVTTSLDAITFLPDSVLQLVEVQGSQRTPIAYQIESGNARFIHWIIETANAKSAKHTYELVKGTGKKAPASINVKDEKGALTIQAGTKNLLRYNYKTVYPPTGIDTAYKRSGFIHPLWTPHGQELTRIQAPDHYHHYGIWNPWTHVLFEKDTVDFWNIRDRKGTVRFANTVATTSGPVFSEYEVLQKHVAFKKGGGEKVALNELQSVRVYQPTNQDYYIADVTINMNCASTSPVLLLAYRYGGFGWRTTEKWNKDNSEVLTSEGKTRKEADGSTARWCIVQGQLDNDYGGLVMMSYPTNYNYPEPLRIWPETMNGRGDMFANFSPTKNKNWLLNPGQTYTLKYRLIVYNGHFTKEKAESGWQYFGHAPKVTVKLK
ncbi:DUF6807 domain-containing protein [Hymenobacter jejuensis]|uniref:Methane oxygenase PmoA n=1 Tax=Hymenobacter jejuensis TaxID=2502781 RepID=A0A5B7ZXI7_9BACT|nr:PmoA family protein [Hymenobacter jejuensis]QDA59226.1 hypothetical protein FHG12_03485 [Hymenobacter jejuensis]